MQTWYLQVQDSEYNVLLLNQEIGNYKKYNKWIEKKIDEIIFRQYPTAKRWEVRTNPYTSRVVMWQSRKCHKGGCGSPQNLLFYIHTWDTKCRNRSSSQHSPKMYLVSTLTILPILMRKRWNLPKISICRPVGLWQLREWHKTPRLPASFLLFYIHTKQI